MTPRRMGDAPRTVLTRRGQIVAGISFSLAFVGAMALVEGLSVLLTS